MNNSTSPLTVKYKYKRGLAAPLSISTYYMPKTEARYAIKHLDAYLGTGFIVWILALSMVARLYRGSPHEVSSLLANVPQNSTRPEFGFIMTRYVRSVVHNELWRENYRCLRQHFPTTPILIIDDYSDLTLVDQNFTMTNAAIIYSELPPGKGEILPYYYFYHKRPFNKAVMLNDGMLLQAREPLRSAILSTSDYRFLWHFDEFRDNELTEQLYLISTLKHEVQDQVQTLRLQKDKWMGCFSSASIMTWEFVAHMHHTYGFLDVAAAIQSRADRMGLERLVGLIAADCDGTKSRSRDEVSVFGSILAHKKTGAYHWQDYIDDKRQGSITEPMIKIWNGR